MTKGLADAGLTVEQTTRDIALPPAQQVDPPRRRDGWRAVPRELLIVVAGIIAYFGVRGRTEGDVDHAFENADRVLNLERSLHVDIEGAVQSPASRSEALTSLLNWVYVWGHWPVIAVSLLWLVLRHREVYVITRTAMLLSGAVGMLVFAFFPVAPPRMLDLGLVDTVTEYSTAYRVLQPPWFTNQYAAMPSLHMGWDLLIGIAIACCARHVWVRVLGWVLPALMCWAVVATANHYVFDAVAGVALVLVSRAVAVRDTWRRARGGTIGSRSRGVRMRTPHHSGVCGRTP